MYSILLLDVIYYIHTVTHEPTRPSATSRSNNTHVNITVTWESPLRSTPQTPLTGYVIYYQPKGGTVINVTVHGGTTENILLEGLQRGVTYNISIVAVSHFRLPSPLVGPITVIPGISGTAIYCFLYNLRGNRGHFVVK